MSGFDKILSIW